MSEEELQQLLGKHRPKGRGGVGSRVDETGPFLPADARQVLWQLGHKAVFLLGPVIILVRGSQAMQSGKGKQKLRGSSKTGTAFVDRQAPQLSGWVVWEMHMRLLGRQVHSSGQLYPFTPSVIGIILWFMVALRGI